MGLLQSDSSLLVVPFYSYLFAILSSCEFFSFMLKWCIAWLLGHFPSLSTDQTLKWMAKLTLYMELSIDSVWCIWIEYGIFSTYERCSERLCGCLVSLGWVYTTICANFFSNFENSEWQWLTLNCLLFISNMESEIHTHAHTH